MTANSEGGGSKPAATADGSAPRETDPPRDAAAAKELLPAGAQAIKVALADFTRSMVQTIDRATYYEVGHPAHYALGAGLYNELIVLLADQPQIGYLLQRGSQPEIFVDGMPTGRVRLSDLYSSGIYELFVPRFIAYLDRYELVLLAFKQGLTQAEFESFVGIVSRPLGRKEDRLDLAATLLEAGVVHISVLCAEDLGLADEDLPWQIRICLARLRRDLRTVPFFKHAGAEEIRKVKQQIFGDIVRPLSQPEQLKQLVLNAPRIEKDVENIDGLEGLKIAETIVQVLAHKRLCQLADLLVGEIAGDGAVHAVAAATNALLMCTKRLLSEDILGAEGTLRLLYKNDVVELDELPGDLQEWLLAEELRDRLEAGTLGELPCGSERDMRLLGRLAQLTLSDDRFDFSVTILQFLRNQASEGARFAGEAAAAIESMVSREQLGILADRLESMSRHEADSIVRIVRLLGLRGAIALTESIVRSGANAHFGNAYHVLDDFGAPASQAIGDALVRTDLPPAVLRVLLALATRHPTARLALAALPHAGHAQPMVRLAALSAAAAHRTQPVIEAMQRALSDPSTEVVEFAMMALAERLGDEESARACARKTLISSAAATPAALLVAAAKVLGQHPGADREAAVATLRDFLARERGGGFLGLGNKIAHPLAVDAAVAAMAALGANADDVPGKKSLLRGLFIE